MCQIFSFCDHPATIGDSNDRRVSVDQSHLHSRDGTILQQIGLVILLSRYELMYMHPLPINTICLSSQQPLIPWIRVIASCKTHDVHPPFGLKDHGLREIWDESPTWIDTKWLSFQTTDHNQKSDTRLLRLQEYLDALTKLFGPTNT